MIPLSVPNVSGREWEYVKDCLDTGWISTAGSYVSRFEEEFAKRVGSEGAVSLMNGTSALHLSLKAVGVQSGELVVIPNVTFVATANAVSYLGADPVLVDVEESHWQMDLKLLEEYLRFDCERKGEELFEKLSMRRVAAILIVHLQGGMCDIHKLKGLCDEFGLPLVEDAAEALGSTIEGRCAGTIGRVGCFSFNGNKIISTGGGGMVVSDDAALIKTIRHLATTAKTDPLRYYHDQVGYNYRMVNVLSAIGLAQLESLDTFIAKKRSIADFYRTNLSDVGDIGFQKILPNVESNEWLFTVRTSKSTDLIEFLNKEGVMSRPFWFPMSKLPMYETSRYVSNADTSSILHTEGVSIPCSTSITERELSEVVRKIKYFFAR
ncbi:LegC family aminotransferase [Pseudomonadales bacterium]|nr:LegC family aminotransferase [Pseudomonadales bacterium]